MMVEISVYFFEISCDYVIISKVKFKNKNKIAGNFYATS